MIDKYKPKGDWLHKPEILEPHFFSSKGNNSYQVIHSMSLNEFTSTVPKVFITISEFPQSYLLHWFVM